MRNWMTALSLLSKQQDHSCLPKAKFISKILYQTNILPVRVAVSITNLFTLDMFNHSIPEKKSKFKNSTKTFSFFEFYFIEKIPRIGKKYLKNLAENVAPNALLCSLLKNCQHFYFQKKTSLEHLSLVLFAPLPPHL